MSHQATNWAVQQRGIKPAAKVVLWHLANRHNPDYGCFPSQARLADDCEMSRSSLNDQLNALEAAGLIMRVQRFNGETKRVESTRYILAFEPEFIAANPEPCPKSAHGPVSENDQEPCPKNGESRVRNSDTNPAREPLRETTRVRATPLPLKAEKFDEAWRSWPAGQGRGCGKENACRAWFAALRDGHDEADMAKGVAAYVASKPAFVTRFDRFIRDQVWKEWLPKPAPSKQRERWQWKNHVDNFKRCGEWRIEGPPPDKPGCLAPADVLAEYGYAVLTQTKSPDSVAEKEA